MSSTSIELSSAPAVVVDQSNSPRMNTLLLPHGAPSSSSSSAAVPTTHDELGLQSPGNNATTVMPHFQHNSLHYHEPIDPFDTSLVDEGRVALLLSAAQKNNTERILALLRSGIPVGASDYDSRTALHIACSDGHFDTVRLLVEEGADVDAKDRFGSTPLDDAMRNTHVEIIKYLKSIGAKHGGIDKLEARLIEACARNNVEEVTKLLDAGVNPNCSDYDRRSPLHLAVAEGNVEIARLLLEKGANINSEDRWGLTPLNDVSRQAARSGSDPMKDLFQSYLPHEEHKTHSVLSFFSVFYGLFEILMMFLFGFFINYADTANGGPAPDDPTNEASALLFRVYPSFQDVHVMIFIGFGFLMVFLRKNGYTSVGLTFLIGAFVIQWYQLTHTFWDNAFSGNWIKGHLDITKFVQADFCAGSVLITYGALLGKVNPTQMLFIAIIETILYSLNEFIGIYMKAADIGGSMTIHMFGATFGLACSLALSPKEARGHHNNAANYHSDIMAMIGTIFLWLFWPSFNGALGIANTQHRAIINTILCLCGSCVIAFIASHIFRKEQKFNMVDIQNATLAGGVAMGACADMIIKPGSAIGIGGISGLVSVLGYVYVQPWLESKIGLHDTCGVNNLHFLPSWIGGFASVIAASQATSSAYGEQISITFPFLPVPGSDDGRTANKQAAVQFAYMMTSFFISLVGGFICGLVCNIPVCKPLHGEEASERAFLDSNHWEVPALETPYYFDHRGEISRGNNEINIVTDDQSNTTTATTTKNEGQLLTDLQAKLNALEIKFNGLSRRVPHSNYLQTHSHHTASAAAVAPTSGTKSYQQSPAQQHNATAYSLQSTPASRRQ